MRDRWLKELREKCFRAWPADSPNDALTLDVAKAATGHVNEYRFSLYEFNGQLPYRLPLIVLDRESRAERVVLKVLSQDDWEYLQSTWRTAFPEHAVGSVGLNASDPPVGMPPFWERVELSPETLFIWTAPRGIGPTEWTRDERERIQIRRRFMLLGQTEHSARVYDVRRAIQAARQVAGRDTPVELQADGDAAVWALYASLFEPPLEGMFLGSLASTHRDGPDFLNVLKILDVPQAVALSADRSPVTVFPAKEQQDWRYPQAVARQLGWDADHLEIYDGPILDSGRDTE
jgi:hypothetical protein